MRDRGSFSLQWWSEKMMMMMMMMIAVVHFSGWSSPIVAFSGGSMAPSPGGVAHTLRQQHFARLNRAGIDGGDHLSMEAVQSSEDLRHSSLPSSHSKDDANQAIRRDDVRNVAIIAHVDHGKTTLIDAILRTPEILRHRSSSRLPHETIRAAASSHPSTPTTTASGVGLPGERVMDREDQEKERGITILSKNAAIVYKGVRINLVDTPGHSDFGGEVERVLNMVDGVILLVDAAEGPKPQTRFVLRKALAAKCHCVVVINKVDRLQARPHLALKKTIDLFLDLEPDEHLLDFEVIWATGLKGQAGLSIDAMEDTIEPLLDAVLRLPGPLIVSTPTQTPSSSSSSSSSSSPPVLQMLISDIEHHPHLGRLAIGRIRGGGQGRSSDGNLEKLSPASSKHHRTDFRAGQSVQVIHPQSPPQRATIGDVMVFEGLSKSSVSSASAGDIVILQGLHEAARIGHTVTDPTYLIPLPSLSVDPPTVRMRISANPSPLAGSDEGVRYPTLGALENRLRREAERNLALRVDSSKGDLRIAGRGPMHLTVLIETLRREGYEFALQSPSVIRRRNQDGVEEEPWERWEVDVGHENVGSVIKAFSLRRGERVLLPQEEDLSGSEQSVKRFDDDDDDDDEDGHSERRVRVCYRLPTRATLGLRSELMLSTRGTAAIESSPDGYFPASSRDLQREVGVITSSATGKATQKGLQHAQEKGRIFIQPGDRVFVGQIVGLTTSPASVRINICKEPRLSNVRQIHKQPTESWTPPSRLSLDEAIGMIQSNEYLEVTPTSIRLGHLQPALHT